MAAGIDDISIYIPRLYVDATDFAKARGLDPAKLQRGLGVSQMAIVDTNQDPAVLAANACLRVMQNNKLSPEDIGRLYVSTESSFDESKAMNSYVIGMLEQVYGQGAFEHCGGVETKFACVSGSYALYDNTNWIRAGEAEGKAALVVVSDKLGYSNVHSCNNGYAAIKEFKKLAKTQTPPIVLLDYMLPDMDCRSVLTQILDVQPNARVVLLSIQGLVFINCINRHV